MKPVIDVHELFRHQRAIRSFTDQDVPEELVRRVLTAAIHGPSGSNTQPWHFIVIRDSAAKRAISDACEEARAAAYSGRSPAAAGPRQPLSAAPVLIVACVDTPASGQAGFRPAPRSTRACRTSCWRRARPASEPCSRRCIAAARCASTRSSAFRTTSRAPRSFRSAGPTASTAPTGARRSSGS